MFSPFRTLVQAGGDFDEQEQELSHHEMVVNAKNMILSMFEEMETDAR